MKRSNKIHNADLFTQAATEQYQKHIRTQSKRALQRINETINWSVLIQPLEQRLSKEKASLSPAGRKPHDLIIIVKCMLLQMMYGLSDPRLEEELADRRSFQLFLGLSSGDSIPDETAICRYRKLFAELELDKILFKNFNKQLVVQGLIIGKGTIVDATLKQAQAKPESGRDKDASFTKRGSKTVYGYKGHVGVDAKTNVIHSVEFTPANVHDTQKFNNLLLSTERAVYADKGYANKARKRRLKRQGIRCGILDKGYRDTPLTQAQRKRNKKLSAIRNTVEQPFAFFKQVLQYTRCRYFDLARNRLQFIFSAVVYNIRRMLSLTMPNAT
jgi:IS5 family transposase